MALGTEVGFVQGHIVLHGDPAPLPQFSAHFYCGHTAGCIKMSLGMDICLSPEDFVLDGDLVTLPKKGGGAPIFGPYLLWSNDWMDQDATWYRGRPRPT